MIKLRNISKSYGEQVIFNDFSMEIKRNEFVVIMGKSGSGKTTLINLLNGLDKPDKGEVEINGIVNPKGRKLMQLRRYTFGCIFQNYGLIDEETVKKNLMLSKTYNCQWKNDNMEKVLFMTGLNKDIINKKVCELSGGEQQRVALARVILKQNEIIFADEPTGNLDDENTELVIDIMKRLNKQGKTIVCVTHNYKMTEVADRVIHLS